MDDTHPFIDYANLPAPSEGIVVTTFITVRSIARSRAFYRDVLEGCYWKWSERGAQVSDTADRPRGGIRCYMRDPDGYLIEVGQATGLLSGHLASRRPEDLPGSLPEARCLLRRSASERSLIGQSNRSNHGDSFG